MMMTPRVGIIIVAGVMMTLPHRRVTVAPSQKSGNLPPPDLKKWSSIIAGATVMISQRSKARQNLLVATINVALERGLIAWEGDFDDAVFDLRVAGVPALAYVKESCGEVFITAMVRPNAEGRRFIRANLGGTWREYAEAYAWGFLARFQRRYLQVAGLGSFGGTREMTATLSGLDLKPHGYSRSEPR